jgi:glyoxylase-like metal-dependent hydrolase (beta-lactamase superfamily II)
MQRSKVTLSGLLLAVGVASLPTVSAQPLITSSPISSNADVYLIQSSMPAQGFMMNNLLLVRPGGVILVDTLPPGPYTPFSAVIHSRTSGQHVNTVINTHWHFDHVGLNSNFRVSEGTGTIIAHWRAGAYLTSAHCIEDIPLCMPAFPDTAQPTQGVYGETTLFPVDERITLKTVENAHSGADLVVYLERANIVYTGDLYFGGMYPIIDRTGGGTVNGMLHGLNQILARIDDSTIVIPSHGVLGNRQSVLEFAAMLETCRKRIRALIAQGLNEQQIMTDSSFADLDAQWGHGFINGPLFRRIVYRDLAPQRGE